LNRTKTLPIAERYVDATAGEAIVERLSWPGFVPAIHVFVS
jgi:hypothetical protein